MNNCMKNNSKPTLWLIEVDQLYTEWIQESHGYAHLTVKSLLFSTYLEEEEVVLALEVTSEDHGFHFK